MTKSEAILAAHRAEPGKTPATIARDLNVSRALVSKALKGAGLPSDYRSVTPNRNAVKPFAERAEFGQMLDLLGMTNKQAAKMLGIHEVTVSKYANGQLDLPHPIKALMLIMIGLGGPQASLPAHDAGVRKLKAAVDNAKP